MFHGSLVPCAERRIIKMNNPFIDVFCPHCGEFVNPIYEGDCPNCGEYIGSDDNEEWDDGSDGDGYYFHT